MPNRQKIIRQLDRLVSIIVRFNNADDDGYVCCVSCGRRIYWKEAHCCHWIERGRYRYRRDYNNLAPGCAGCNTFRKEYHSRMYTLYQINRLGQSKVQEMVNVAEKDKKKIYKIPTSELIDILENIKKEYEQIKKTQKRQKLNS